MWLLVSLFLVSFSTMYGTISYTVKNLADNKKIYTISFQFKPHEVLYKDSLAISIDNHDLQIESWMVKEQPHNYLDQHFQESKEGYQAKATIPITIAGITPDRAHLHIIYQTNLMPGPEDRIIPVKPNDQPMKSSKNDLGQSKELSSDLKKTTHQNLPWSEKIGGLMRQTNSMALRLILVFLLGLLLSLTPCIYPMIPITIGILQAHGSRSLFSNFLVSLLYTCGMATTFALFGLLASCVGPLCGKLLVQPAFIIAFVALLAYFAFSMFGFYDMYMPPFMKTSATVQKRGSYLAVFLFGAASGTIASPCVSPGLALVLTVAAALGNGVLGFLLLFVFGIGLSMPLMIVGTFSSSLTMLPRAGMWMIEIKKLFGFMIFAMCFYYLSYITPLHYLLWIAALLIFIIGIFYLYSAQKSRGFWKLFNLLLGIALICYAPVLVYKGFKEYYLYNTMTCHFDQEPVSYECALEQARSEHKLLFVDFWATFCPVCLAINKKVLPNKLVKQALEKYIVLKVNGTYSSQEPYAMLEKKFNITGFPVFLIIDPHTEKVLARWGSEMYDTKPADLAEKLYGFVRAN